MNYSRVFIDAIAYVLPPIVVSSAELEERLRPVYRALRFPEGQLEALTGIIERRWWEAGFSIAQGATQAGRKALDKVGLKATDLDALIYGGVCREHFEPATACHVAANLGVSGSAAVHDVSNACLGVLNGMVDIANRIELGQIRAGMAVSCESARDINDLAIQKLCANPTMDLFRTSLATLTGGSGAVAVLLTDGSFDTPARTRLLGGAAQTAPQFHELCRWGLEPTVSHGVQQFMNTDSVGILKHGVSLGLATWDAFLTKMGWTPKQIDKVICHQVGAAHRDGVLSLLGISAERDFSTFAYLGNIGTVSLPLTAALADEREFLMPGDRVAFMGIASGLNCMMLGVQW